MYKENALVRRNSELFYFRHAPPHLERAQPEDAYSGNRPQPPYSGAQGWKCSVYYYWWRFVREVPGLREQVAQPLELLPVESIAPDFNRIFDCNFREWWSIQGRELFSEPRETGVKIETLPIDASSVQDSAIFSIPLNGDLEQAMSELRHLLKPEMAEFQVERGPSRARYPVYSSTPLSSLHTIYTMWRTRRDHPNLKLFEIADFITGDLGKISNDAEMKSTKSASVSRYLRKAKCIIEYVGHGLFPVLEPSEKANLWVERLASERRKRAMKQIVERRRSAE